MKRINNKILGIFFACLILLLAFQVLRSYMHKKVLEIPVNLSQLDGYDHAKQWQEIAAKLQLDPYAKLESLKLVYKDTGEIQKESYELVGRNKDNYMYYYVDYDFEESKAIVRRQKLKVPWITYDRSIQARYFWEQMNEMDLTLLKPAGEYPFRQLRLHGGVQVNYAIKDMKKYRIDKNQIEEIANSELPVEGFWLSVCGMPENAAPDFVSPCEDRLDYILDASAR